MAARACVRSALAKRGTAIAVNYNANADLAGSEEGRYITNQKLTVNGGESLKRGWPDVLGPRRVTS